MKASATVTAGSFWSHSQQPFPVRAWHCLQNTRSHAIETLPNPCWRGETPARSRELFGGVCDIRLRFRDRAYTLRALNTTLKIDISNVLGEAFWVSGSVRAPELPSQSLCWAFLSRWLYGLGGLKDLSIVQGLECSNIS